MPGVNLEKLKKISCNIKSLCQLVFILNTYLNANQDYSEECSNALILSEIVFAELEKRTIICFIIFRIFIWKLIQERRLKNRRFDLKPPVLENFGINKQVNFSNSL